MITNWDITKEDHDLLVQCAERALRELNYPDDQRTIMMDLCACHSNGCPLDFKGLLEAPLQDFSHDIWGIRKAINRDTGKLTEDVFTPRYALANRVPVSAGPRCTQCNEEFGHFSHSGGGSTPHPFQWPAPTSTLPGGITVTGGSQDQHDILRARGEFVARYCTAKGWDVNNMTIEQILEIRSQSEWKNPGGTNDR